MVLARRSKAASELSRQIRENAFEKEYLAVVRGHLPAERGTLTDLLLRNKAERKTYVVQQPEKDAQEAVLDYTKVAEREDLTKVRIVLRTGRTHQIRCQFASRGLPLVGDRKYGQPEETGNIALWSCRLAFRHPYSGEPMEFFHEPPAVEPWVQFRDQLL
jgi:23S rRNA pseudouridine1911/1915/1917 synthase